MRRKNFTNYSGKYVKKHHKPGGPGRKTALRIISLLLCLCMVIPMLCKFGGMVLPTTAAAEQTENALNRIADGDTTDTYEGKLLSDEWGSRYAGRVWTDKSVFAYGTPITLNTATDGYDGSVGFNADFGTVFSALTSTQRINEYPPSPIDLVILIDMSGSMAADIVGSDHTHEDYMDPNGERITHSRIYAVLESINSTIQELMDMGEANRVAVVGYGATAYTLMELGHYKTDTTGKYLEVGNFRAYGGNNAPGSSGSRSAAYMVGTVAGLRKLDESVDEEAGEAERYKSYSRHARNDYVDSGVVSDDPDDTISIGFHTDLQAGIYEGFEELYKHYQTKESVIKTYITEETHTPVVVQRIPVAIVMTDGGSNYTLQDPDGATGNEWFNVPIKRDNVTSYSGKWTKYRTEALEGALFPNNKGVETYDRGGDATILDILMTASYEKSKVQKKYAKLVQEAKDANLLEEARRKEPIFRILTVSVDTPDNEWQMPRVYASLDPSHFFNDDPQENNGINPLSWTQRDDIIHAYEAFTQWQKADGPITVGFTDSDAAKEIQFNQLPDPIDPTDVTKDDVINNINYNTRFEDISSSALTATFDNMLNEVRGLAFTPLSGENATGVADSVTYQDPLGEYMEFKHNAITITEGEVAGTTDKTFDMAALLFGEMHGLVRAGVYDYQWNDKYMLAHPDVGTHGVKPFPTGWYKGDPEDAYQPEKTAADESGSWPAEDPVTGATYKNAEEAWADGWVMRFDFQTMLSFVPIANAPESGLPENLDESVKNTIYTCYRFADSQTERNKLRRNPIFGEVPETLEQEWEAYYEQNGSYPVGMGKYNTTAGVYRLSDIRVWAEHTGDFIDETGAITPEDQSGYDDALYVNIPVVAVPTQLAEITIGAEGAISYKDNLNEKTQSSPFRVFYAVGLTEDLIQRDSDGNQTGVDVSKISGEYISSHSDPTTGNIYFISNWYSNTAYRGYTSDEAEASRTRGDAVVTFSPNVANRYYLFQKPLPLIAHAYRVQNDAGDVAPVDNATGADWSENGSGNGSSTWEDGQVGGATWSGGEFIGTYENEEAFKAALQAKTKGDDDVFYIEDAKGYSYPLPPDITNAIITYTKDQLSNVDSDGDGYADNANSFSSDDYFFLCVEYYMPMAGYGKDIHNREDTSTRAVCKVYRMIARKGSAFGSGLQSEHIGNGDMLCWHDIKGNCTQEIAYNSRTDTGDITRGRPTLEKLTKTGGDLRTYLSEKCGISEGYLDQECAKWTALQGDAHMQSLIRQINSADDKQAMFDELFDWSVSAKTHGIRVGDMFNNMQAKSGDLVGGYYTGNVTQTANNYYIPTLSEKSTAGDGLIINNYLGNNGRLEVANDTLMVTKTLVAPEGFNLTDKQQNEKFQYQVYVQGMTGERSAQRLKWNPFSQSWQRRVETLEILTDNSSLLLDTNGSRALFCFKDGKLQQVVAVIDNETGLSTYFYANPDGSATTEKCDHTDELYCIYLPDHDGDLTYRLFASDYDTGTELIDSVGTTAYYPHGMDTKKLPEADHDSQEFAEEITDKGDGSMDNRPAGSREYWTDEAKLIPYQEIIEAEANNGILGIMTASLDAFDEPPVHIDYALMALMAESDHWSYDETKGYADAPRLPLVTVIPNKDSTESTVYSPFSSRTQYMTVPLYFGFDGDLAAHLAQEGETLATCPDLDDYRLTGDFLYDKSVPTTERSDLFNADKKHNADSNRIAQNTAEFTLKAGEGLLLTGLGNRITYRFTELLTNDQLAQGYSLKEVNHIEEPDSGSLPDSSLHDDTGIYSVFGDTDHASEQTHYTNTVDPELFVLIKKMVSKDGTPVVVAPNQEFTFTLTFTPDPNAAMTDMDDVLHYWKGDKDTWTSAEEWTDEGDGTTYHMPESAPLLDGYETYLTDGTYRLKPIRPDEDATDRTYTIKLKANEAIVFYGLIAGMTYSVTETTNETYPIVPDTGDGVSAGGYTKSGTILRVSEDPRTIYPAQTPNRAEFTNLLETGTLTVEKRINGTEPDTGKEFGFTVTLTPASGTELKPDDLKATKYKADGTAYDADDFTIHWDETGGVLKADVTLKHNEKLLIEGILVGTTYVVEESQKDGYNLQHVASNQKDNPEDTEGNYLPLTDKGNGVTGVITIDKSQAYLLFVNDRASFPPFTGGPGWTPLYLLGLLLLLVPAAAVLFRRRRRSSM